MDIALGADVVLKVKLNPEAREKGLLLPSYSREGDAGLDLRALEDVDIKPGERRLIGTGMHLAIPSGFVGIIKDRSGLALKQGIHIMAGVIDSNYRGEIKVVVLNTAAENYHVETGQRVAQMLILPVARVKIEESSSLDATNRNENGWGSTGRQ
ncbi:MAG: dUTP diphosphatase [Candidatus Omnitrophota bacterium]|nr:dUTP diphosphatase [Candidatus Omnitrophota bacterium]